MGCYAEGGLELVELLLRQVGENGVTTLEPWQHKGQTRLVSHLQNVIRIFMKFGKGNLNKITAQLLAHTGSADQQIMPIF